MTLDVVVDGVTQRFGDVVALDDVSLTFGAGKITGLLGRNGSGKSTILAIVAAYRRVQSGSVRIDGADPFENERLAPQVCLVRESGDIVVSERIGTVLGLAAELRPTWDHQYADELIGRFGLDARRRVSGLSRGQRAALGVTLGLASRAPLTMFDESYLGMDAPSRQMFYEELLADYLVRPRTIVLSTHLIDEMAPLFEDVVIVDRGHVLIQDTADDLREHGTTVTGPADAVERFTSGMPHLSTQRLGPTVSAVVLGRLDDERRAAARQAGLELGPIGMQDLMIHLTAEVVG